MSGRVAVSGMGVVSPLGIGVEAYREGLEAGRCAVEPLDLFDISGYRSGAAARVRELPRPDAIGIGTWRHLDRCDRMAVTALEEALQQAGWPDTTRAAVCCGMSGPTQRNSKGVLFS